MTSQPPLAARAALPELRLVPALLPWGCGQRFVLQAQLCSWALLASSCISLPCGLTAVLSSLLCPITSSAPSAASEDLVLGAPAASLCSQLRAFCLCYCARLGSDCESFPVASAAPGWNSI